MKKYSVKTISFTSGKGGVGKTSVAVNMASSLAQMGKRVLILDGDMSLANVDIFLKSKTKKTLEHFFNHQASLSDVIIKHSRNIHIIPGGSGVSQLTQLDVFQKQMLIEAVSGLESKYDYLFIDTASGISDEVLYLSSAAQEVYVVVNPDPSSITDSYALMKVMYQQKKVNQFKLIANQVLNESEALSLFNRLSCVASKYLNIKVDYAGFIPFDLKLRQANMKQQLLSEYAPQSLSSHSIKNIVSKLDNQSNIQESNGGLQFFWHQVLNVA